MAFSPVSTEKIEFNIDSLESMREMRTAEIPEVVAFIDSRRRPGGRLQLGERYNCPVCKKICKTKLEVYCEYVIDIRKIVLEHGERLNWNTFEMFQLIIEEDRERNLRICCPKCCKEIRENKKKDEKDEKDKKDMFGRLACMRMGRNAIVNNYLMRKVFIPRLHDCVN